MDFEVTGLPEVSTHHDVTVAYLVGLARAHGLRLATLDRALITKSWASGIAFHPFAPLAG